MSEKAEKGKHSPSKSDSVSVKVLLPGELYADLRDIVTYLGRWNSLSQFMRFALLHERERWIDEMRRRKEEVERGYV